MKGGLLAGVFFILPGAILDCKLTRTVPVGSLTLVKSSQMQKGSAFRCLASPRPQTRIHDFSSHFLVAEW